MVNEYVNWGFGEGKEDGKPLAKSSSELRCPLLCADTAFLPLLPLPVWTNLLRKGNHRKEIKSVWISMWIKSSFKRVQIPIHIKDRIAPHLGQVSAPSSCSDQTPALNSPCSCLELLRIVKSEGSENTFQIKTEINVQLVTWLFGDGRSGLNWSHEVHRGRMARGWNSRCWFVGGREHN